MLLDTFLQEMTGSDEVYREFYKSPLVCQITGITYRHLDYWVRSGLVVPSARSAAGSGAQNRLYSFRDVVLVKIIKCLLDLGLTLSKVRVVVDFLRDVELDDLVEGRLFFDGSVFHFGSGVDVDDFLFDRRVFSIVNVGFLMRDTFDTIVNFSHAGGGNVFPILRGVDSSTFF